MNDVDAGFFHRANVESVGVEKLYDEDAENILIGKLKWGVDAGEAAEQIAERGSAGFRRMIRGKEFEQTIANSWLFFVDDGVACAVDQNLRFHDSRQGNDLAANFQGVGHGQGIGMARNGNYVFGPKDVGLFQNFSA